ncbi:hypothetical protein SDC9_172473 [bioreactor metagenome]|uniref:Uncharacterized protein n=1 Tax=bioreactor metagenome TaxID=1076179 RepID=A0A645GFX2_9ZZZZ
MANRQRQRQAAAERVADQIGAFDLQGIQQTDGLLHPGVHGVDEVLRALAVAEADHVGCDHARLLCQLGHYQPPVGPCRNARARTVDHQQRVAFADVVVVGANACGSDAVGDLGIAFLNGFRA